MKKILKRPKNKIQKLYIVKLNFSVIIVVGVAFSLIDNLVVMRKDIQFGMGDMCVIQYFPFGMNTSGLVNLSLRVSASTEIGS